MSWADENLTELRNRAGILADLDIGELFVKWRKIVGPRPDQLGELARGALDALRSGGKPTPAQRQALERAIRLLRPAVPVGKLDLIDAEAKAAFPGWDTFGSAVDRYLPAIGRIDIPPRSAYEAATPFATGFLIAEDILVTNDHVVGKLTVGTGFLIPGQAEVRFGQELDRSDERGAVPVEEVIARDPDLDLALLRLAPGVRSEHVIPFGTVEIEGGAPIAAVGFPVPGLVDMEVASGLLGPAFGVKRVSPGVVIERRDSVLSHDCTTLGGSSGSPVFTLGEVASLVGVHYDGWYLTSNHAVCGAAMCQFLKEHCR